MFIAAGISHAYYNKRENVPYVGFGKFLCHPFKYGQELLFNVNILDLKNVSLGGRGARAPIWKLKQ